MKLFTTAAVALCLFMFVGCDAADTETPPTPDTRIIDANNKVQANITGMDCTGCSGSIVAAIEKINGVTAAHADVASGDVIVALEDGIKDPEAVKAEIEATILGLSKGKYAVKTINVSIADVEDAAKDQALPAEDPAAVEEPAAQEPATDEQASTEPAEEAFVFTSYKVTGMDCTGCSSQIVKAVEQVDGVKQVEADHMTGAVKVSFEDRFDDKVKTDEIKGVIAGLSDGKYTVSY